MYTRLALLGAVLGGAAVIGFQASRGGVESDPEAALDGPTASVLATVSEAAAPEPAPDLAAALSAAETERLRLEAALAEAEAEIARLDAALSARIAEEVSAAMATRDAELARLEVALLEQTAEIARLTQALADRDADIARLLDMAKATALTLPPLAPLRAGAAPLPRPGTEALDAEMAALKDVPIPRPVRAGEMPLAEVHFDMGSSTLSPGAEARAREAAAVLAGMAFEKIRVTGHSDTTGNPRANLALSRARAEAVAAVLTDAGLPADRIEIEAFGPEADVLPVRTGAGVPEPLNRCVGIWPVLAAQ